MDKYHLTQQSLDKFNQELAELKKQLVEVIKLVANAREQGDLSENSEYQSAKNDQDMINNRIAELEGIIKNHILVDDSNKHNSSVVELGSTIKLQGSNGHGKRVYKLVGTLEVDPFEGRISLDSEVGRSLVGKIAGEEVSLLETDGQQATYKIVAVE